MCVCVLYLSETVHLVSGGGVYGQGEGLCNHGDRPLPLQGLNQKGLNQKVLNQPDGMIRTRRRENPYVCNVIVQ